MDESTLLSLSPCVMLLRNGAVIDDVSLSIVVRRRRGGRVVGASTSSSSAPLVGTNITAALSFVSLPAAPPPTSFSPSNNPADDLRPLVGMGIL